MQIRVALCDDETVSFALSCFSSGRELLNYIDTYESFHIYILDIIMPDINGIQLGSALRERGDDGLIIYLTSSPDFALESYNTDALHYLLKPINNEPFFQCMDKAMNRLNRPLTETISIKTSGSTRIIPVHNILYAERVNRIIRYNISDGSAMDSVTFNGTFQNAVSTLLSRHGFLIVGSSFVVNLFHVTEVTKSDMLLDGKHLVPI